MFELKSGAAMAPPPPLEEKGPGFSHSHMHLIPVYQLQGDNDAVKSHGRLYGIFTVELALLI